MATPAIATAPKPSVESPSSATAATTPASPTSPKSMLSPTETGWKITIKNSDGTSNEMILEPKTLEHTDTKPDVPPVEYADPEKAQDSAKKDPVKSSPKLRAYLIIQYVLNATLAIVIVVIMALTLALYNSHKNVPGSFPASPTLSPTFIMLVVSCVNVLVDAANLVVQCCGIRVVHTMAIIVTKVRNVTGVITAIMPAIAAGFFRFAYNSTNNSDLWGWSCNGNSTNTTEVQNTNNTICNTNGAAYALQLLQIFFQLLSVVVPLYGKWRVMQEAAALAPKSDGGDGKGKDDAKMEKQDTNDQADMLIDESQKAFASMTSSDMK